MQYRSTNTALDRAISDLGVMMDAKRERYAAFDRHPVTVRLNQIIAANTRRFDDGCAGGRQVFASITGPENAKARMARHLHTARQCSAKGKRQWLEKAAVARRDYFNRTAPPSAQGSGQASAPNSPLAA